jgi:solute carrier family 25 protein 42
MAGAVAQTLSYPFDVVRRRLQTATVLNPHESNLSILNLFVKIWKNEGLIRGFYKGLSLNWIKGPIAAGVGFMVYDLTQLFIRKSYIKFYDN